MPLFLPIILGSALSMVLLMGCHRAEDQKKKQEKAEKEAALKRIQKESEQIWKESNARKNANGELGPEGGTLFLGNRTLVLTELSLILGPLKIPGDPAGGQESSELKGSSSRGESFRIGVLPIETATKASEVTSQSVSLAQGPNADAEIITEDGSHWLLQNVFVSFIHVRGDVVFLTVDGKAFRKNQSSSEAIKITGELYAKVIAAGEKSSSRE